MGLTGKIIQNGKRTFILPGDARKIHDKKLNNNSDNTRFFFFASPMFTRNKPLSVHVSVKTLEGEACAIFLADRSFSFNQTIQPNQLTTLSESKKIQFLVFAIPPNTEVLVENVELEALEQENNLLVSKANGDYLVITDEYPSEQNPNDPHRLHDRVSSYIESGLNVNVVEVGHKYTGKTVARKYEEVNVLSTSFSNLRNHLQKKQYRKIVLADFSTQIIQIIDATDTTSLELIFLVDNEMLLYPQFDAMYRPYFTREISPDTQARLDLNGRNEAIEKYAALENAVWVFPSKLMKEQAEATHGLEFNNKIVIPPAVSLDVFSTPERKIDTVRSFALIRDFSNNNRNAVDIDVRTILGLSSKPYFDRLSFEIFGAGTDDDYAALTEPLKQFDNVSIHKCQPSQIERSHIYRRNDILLAADRFNANTLDTYEAALTGIIPVISAASTELSEVLGKSFETLAVETEATDERVALIDRIITGDIDAQKLSESVRDAAHKFRGTGKKYSDEIALLKKRPMTFWPSVKDALKSPILTVVIPSYNVEPFLRNCVFSLINHSQAHKLEVLIVNDGSKDNTAAIGKEIEKLTETKNGPVVRLIDKENGGHGSTINAGIREARGKYFRLLDGDDYFITKNFEKFIGILEKEDSDIVLTDLVEDYAISATKIFKNYYGSIKPGQKNSLDVMNFAGYGFGEWGPLLSTTTVKTQLLKDAQFAIDEHCFYVDMEYNFMIYSMAKDITYYPITIYNYYLGRVGQSMSKESMMRNVLHHEKVTLRLIAELYARRDHISEQKQAYIINKLIIPLTKVQYYITTEYFNEKTHFVSFDKKLKQYPEFYNNPEIAGNIIKLHRATTGNLVFSDAALKRLKRAIGR